MKKALALAAVLIGLCGCATFHPSYKQGNVAELNKNWEEAIKLYEAAALADPSEPVYRLALARVRFAAGLASLQEARRLAGEGQREEAMAAYEKALSFDPLNRLLLQEMRRFSQGETPRPQPEPVKLEFPIKLRAAAQKVVLNFPVETSLLQLFLTLGKSAGMNILFDENFRDIPFAVTMDDVTFEQALGSLCTSTKNFYRIIDERTVIIIPDQPMKRMQYEVTAIKTIYLSNIRAEEIYQPLQQMISSQFKAAKVFADKSLNAITVRDNPATVELATRLLAVWDKPKGEVVIDLEVMEVSRIKLRQLGISFDQNIVGLRYGAGTSEEGTGWVNLKDLDLGETANYGLSLPLAFFQFLESDTDTKIIAQPRLRGVADEEIKYLVGQKVPIPRTTFTPIAAGGVSQQPVTSFDYQDVGIDILITPRLHFEDEVTLTLQLVITSLGGKGYADIPIITTREIKNVIRLKDGETNLLAGLLRDEERKSLKGIPGIMNLPLIGRVFSSEDTTIEQTDVILMITPYIIRRMPLGPEDSKPLWVDIEESGLAGGAGTVLPEEEMFNRELLRTRPVPETGRETETRVSLMTLSPPNFEVPRNREFRLMVNMRSTQAVGNLSLNIAFNPQVLRLKDILDGPVIRQAGGEGMPFLKNIESASGTATIGFSSPDLSRGLTASGNIAVLVFEAAERGEAVVSITGITANGPGGRVIPFESRNARVVVR